MRGYPVPIGTINTTPQPRGGRLFIRIKTEKGWRWKLESRYIWELKNGFIPDKCCIHHLNGRGNDNRIENLQLVKNNSEHHRKYHSKRPPSHGIAVSHGLKGKPKSLEHAHKISIALKGKSKSETHKNNLSKAIKIWWNNKNV